MSGVYDRRPIGSARQAEMRGSSVENQLPLRVAVAVTVLAGPQPRVWGEDLAGDSAGGCAGTGHPGRAVWARPAGHLTQSGRSGAPGGCQPIAGCHVSGVSDVATARVGGQLSPLCPPAIPHVPVPHSAAVSSRRAME